MYIMRALAGIFPLVLLASACSSVSGGSGGAGGAGPPPPTPRGAWYVYFQPQPGNIAACLVAGHQAVVGAVTDHTKDHLVADGSELASVTCTVKSLGAAFQVQAKETQQNAQGNAALELSIPSITANATDMAPAPGTVSYSSTITGGVSYTPPAATPCSFYFLPNTGEGVASGRVWVAFKCDAIVDAASSSTCAIKQGFAIFENCLQK